jgi:hypothetical protein
MGVRIGGGGARKNHYGVRKKFGSRKLDAGGQTDEGGRELEVRRRKEKNKGQRSQIRGHGISPAVFGCGRLTTSTF